MGMAELRKMRELENNVLQNTCSRVREEGVGSETGRTRRTRAAGIEITKQRCKNEGQIHKIKGCRESRTNTKRRPLIWNLRDHRLT